MSEPTATGTENAARLSVKNLHAWYGDSHVLHGMTFEVRQGEVVSLLGRNGAGKTTTLKSIMGMIPSRRGYLALDGDDIGSLRSFQIARRGLAYCPEERGILGNLTVKENLYLPPVIKKGGLSASEIDSLFPNLRERLRSQGSMLSGGEQQMLAIARILRTGADFFLLDEPTEGLAPVIVRQIESLIHFMKKKLFTILLVEQSLAFSSAVADAHYIVEHGKIVDRIEKGQLEKRRADLLRYLGV